MSPRGITPFGPRSWNRSIKATAPPKRHNNQPIGARRLQSISGVQAPAHIKPSERPYAAHERSACTPMGSSSGTRWHRRTSHALRELACQTAAATRLMTKIKCARKLAERQEWRHGCAPRCRKAAVRPDTQRLQNGTACGQNRSDSGLLGGLSGERRQTLKSDHPSRAGHSTSIRQRKLIVARRDRNGFRGESG
jgi:hypothetical protein